MAKKSRVFKIPVICILFSLFTAAAWAQNGIPIGALRDNPYFANGTDLEYIDEEALAEYEKEVQFQYDDPSNPETFYNAQNWNEGGTAPDAAFQGPLVQDPNLPPQPDLPTPQDPFFTDEQLREALLGSMYYKSVLNVTAGFMSSLNLSNTDRTIGYYFSAGKPVDFEPLGANLSLEYVLGKRSVRFGPGIKADWNLLSKKYKYYKVSVHELAGDLYVYLQKGIGERFVFSMRLGGGILALLNLKTVYNNGLQYNDGYWLYPEAFTGMSLKYYPTRHFGGGFSLDVHYPFMVEKENPWDPLYARIQFGFSFCGRF